MVLIDHYHSNILCLYETEYSGRAVGGCLADPAYSGCRRTRVKTFICEIKTTYMLLNIIVICT